MLSLVGLRGVLGLPGLFAAGTGALHGLTSSWVRAQQAKKNEAAGRTTEGVKPFSLEVVVDLPQLERILQHPDVAQGLQLRAALGKQGALETCTSCGALTK